MPGTIKEMNNEELSRLAYKKGFEDACNAMVEMIIPICLPCTDTAAEKGKFPVDHDRCRNKFEAGGICCCQVCRPGSRLALGTQVEKFRGYNLRIVEDVKKFN